MVVLLWLAPICRPVRCVADSGALWPCLDRAIRGNRGAGPAVARRLPARFMIAPDSAYVRFAVPRADCVAVLAAGRRQVQDLQVTLHDPVGRSLARSGAAPAAFAYARACVRAGSRLIARIHVREGRGEVATMALRGAPPALPDLATAMGRCRGVGLPRPPPVDVGPEPIGPSLGRRLEALTGELAERGYRPLGEPEEGLLGPLGRQVRRLPLPTGRCLALAVAMDSGPGGLHLRVFSPEAAPRLLDSDSAEGRPAVVKLCAEQPGDHLLELRSEDHGGRYLLQRLGLQAPADGVEPPGLTPMTRRLLWETQWQLAAEGLRIEHTQWAQLDPRSGYRAPIALQEGRCYGIGALGVTDEAWRDLDLSVTDGQGNMIAFDSGLGRVPLVYVCPTQTATYGATLRATAAGRSVRALVIIAGDR